MAIVSDPALVAISRGVDGIAYVLRYAGIVVIIGAILPPSLRATGQSMAWLVGGGIAAVIAGPLAGVMYEGLGGGVLFAQLLAAGRRRRRGRLVGAPGAVVPTDRRWAPDAAGLRGLIGATYHRAMHMQLAPMTRRPRVMPSAIGLAIALMGSAGGPAGAQDAGAGALDVASVPPPSWVQPGARVTFYSAAAAVAQSRYQLIEDPDGPWQDPVTGKHYRSTEETGEGIGGASGDGVSQVDVVAVEGNDVVLGLTMFGIDRGSGTLAVLPGTGAKLPGGAVDGLWIAPVILDQLQTGSLGGLLVLRGAYPLHGTTYQAVSVVNPTPGAYSSQTYDTLTGVLLASTTNTAGAVSPVQLPGQAPTQGASQLTISRFVSIRQLTTPGIGSMAPPWVATSPGLSYAGEYRWANPLDPSSGSFSAPMTADVSFTGHGPTWATYGLRTQVATPGATPGDSTGVSSGTGAYWWDPTALAGFTPGQVLDTDPVTTLTVWVTAVDRGQAGPVVTITSQVPGTSLVSNYDVATGVLLGQAIDVASSGTSVQLGLQRMP